MLLSLPTLVTHGPTPPGAVLRCSASSPSQNLPRCLSCQKPVEKHLLKLIHSDNSRLCYLPRGKQEECPTEVSHKESLSSPLLHSVVTRQPHEYLVAVAGNLLFALVISSSSSLHTPMYFFIATLSCVDTCFTSVTVPKMLLNIQAQSQAIPHAACLTQMCFTILFLELDNVLLAVMVYDRFVAIGHPLHYTTTMSPKFCITSVCVALTVTNIYPLIHTLLMNAPSFCASVRIHHIFCELYALLKLRYPHQTLFRVYLRPSSSYTAEDSVATVLYAVVAPMLNPFIYSLRNKDMKGALRHLFSWRRVWSW
ncbi:hypothetical protein E2I00_011049 [Balaenoptera physalus]|uniref:G-protein coupled receptors family 1 profile domain-containing protein n=1 Tax=Balaenoptera physalus TaxID=9770 RepID=A0A643BSR1_BALPH|nr:hypothetical protein E2I00_011049 [Balaenoptera physalus]